MSRRDVRALLLALAAPCAALPFAWSQAQRTMRSAHAAEMNGAISKQPTCAMEATPGSPTEVEMYLELFRRALVGHTALFSKQELLESHGQERSDALNKGVLSNAGYNRMRNLECILRDVEESRVPGDFVECGIWRGGVTTYMAGFVHAHRLGASRHVWGFDSFMGVPPRGKGLRDERHDRGFEDKYSRVDVSGVGSQQEGLRLVQKHVDSFDVGRHVTLVPGWFNETCPVAKVQRIAVLRVDGDLYSSTMQVLESLYPKVSVGGWVVLDDWGVKQAQLAVYDFRRRWNITSHITFHNGPLIYPVGRWKKEAREVAAGGE